MALCQQQYCILSASLPAVHIRLLIGSDNVDRWGEQRIWDILLSNFRIVVSTHAVLADALAHGFVTMDGLGLLVFDEGKLSNVLRLIWTYQEQLTTVLGTIRRTRSWPTTTTRRCVGVAKFHRF